MPRQFYSFLIICLSFLLPTQNLAAKTSTNSAASSTRVQVVYVIEGNTILTYDVDQQTLTPTQVGSLVVNNTGVEYYALYSSPNDHFLYLIAYHTDLSKRLSVYRTSALGAPQAPSTQELSFNGFHGFQFDPGANFAYAVFGFPDGAYNTAFHIRRYVVNFTNGSLSSPVSEAKYVLPSNPSGEDCGVATAGFNPPANTLYDEVFCSSPDNISATYYERSVNTATGALGPDIQVYSWNNGTQGFESVQFVANHMFDFVVPNNYQSGINSVNVYPIVPNTKTPTIHCTGAMLEACGSATGVAHPSGKFVFMGISSDTTQIDRVELSAHKIVDTGNYIPYQFARFSPDGSLAYGINNLSSGDYYIEISGFNVATSGVAPGGAIYVPSGLGPWIVAERY
jgi:hypothetical protein